MLAIKVLCIFVLGTIYSVIVAYLMNKRFVKKNKDENKDSKRT